MKPLTPPKLILIEGVPGSGKSTLAESIAYSLTKSGFPARWHHEHDPDHPIMPRSEPGAMDAPERRLARWATLVNELNRRSESVVLESSFFQRQTNAYVGARKEEAAAPFLSELYTTVETLAPLLVYFTQPDMEAHFRWLEIRRPGALEHFRSLLIGCSFASNVESDPFFLVTKYFSRVQAFTLRNLEQFPGPVCQVDSPRSDWAATYHTISTFLGAAIRLS